ncbi:MAG TPA: hypothetical protein VHG28_08910 [Longimicrobiaceae bacterium]|nr:hypothetical protein [Longimicrobiaceae bacterium]
MTRRAWTLVAFLLVVVAARLGKEVYNWIAYADERERLVAMRTRLVDAGVEVLQSRARLDTLRQEIDREDRALEQERRALDAYGRRAQGRTLPAHLYAAYRVELDRYNQHVVRRNERFREWEKVIAQNHASVDRYNALADSARALARELGDPYYPIPTPLEAAEERGVVRAQPTRPGSAGTPPAFR